MKLKRLNTIVGWCVFAIALFIYGITMEKTASFWDCGEFIAAAHKLQIVHPPGAPLYLLLGKLFSMFLPTKYVALGVNFLSAFSTALAALFVFWSTTILAKRVLRYNEENQTTGEIITILGAGTVAAFAFVFQDSQWFNAVEAEVYALSTAMTAAVIWMALTWSEKRHQPGADRWLIGIALVIGLSLGVHLLNLLAIPAIALLYYFYKRETISAKGGIFAFLIGAFILLFIQYGVILEFPKIGSGFEIFFVNSLGLPFGSGLIFLLLLIFLIPVFLVLFVKQNKPIHLFIAIGIIVFIAISEFFKVDTFSGSVIKAIVIAGIGYLLYYFRDKKKLLYTVAFSFGFIMIGYLSYIYVPIRSLANPPIDINNPDNVFSLLSYLSREQYGEKPLAYGPIYTAEVAGTKEVGKVYQKKGDRYEIIDRKLDYEFDSNDKMLFPRAWMFHDKNRVKAYQDWLGHNGQPLRRPPNMIDNLSFFFTYQLDFMYWRYFMWNFGGKQNNLQGHGNADAGNWQSGIPLADNGRTLQAEVVPTTVGHNPSVNHFYLLPFIFGVLGLILQFRFAKKDAIVITTLFLMTGVAIVVYLNQEPLQPRERDYAYVGSFLAFSIWIGLAVAGLYRVAKSLVWKDITYILTGFSIVLMAMIVMGFGTNNPGTLLPIALYVIVVAAVIYAITLQIGKTNTNVSAILTTLFVGIVPVLMGFVGWDDHDRNQLHLARAVGANYLTSCDKDAILFTEGDNDTYPLWYAQEVELVRPDVRIVNNSLLKGDWYANQVRQHNGFQPGLTFTFEPEDYESGKREAIYFQEQFAEITLPQLIKWIKSDSPKTKANTASGQVDVFPAKTFTLTIDKEAQIKNGLVSKEEAQYLVDTLRIQLRKDILIRDEFLIYDLVQQYINERPIYFTGENLPNILGLSPYIRREGSSLRLIPIQNPLFGSEDYSPFDPMIHEDKTLQYMKEEMDWGNISSGVYLEETAQRQVMRVFDYSAILMNDFARNEEKEKALDIYNLLKEHIYSSSVPKDEIYMIYKNTGIIDALLLIGENEEALEITKQTVESAINQLQYMNTATLPIANSVQLSDSMISVIDNIQRSAKLNNAPKIVEWIEKELTLIAQNSSQ